MNHWTDAKLCQLVTLYSQFNNLWDKNHPCYFNHQSRHKSYDKIRKSLSTPGVTVTHVLSILWDLRNDYVAELRKVQLAKKQNSPYRPRKKWFYSMHQFLYDYLDSDEKPSEDSSATSIISSCSTSSLAEDQQCFENQNRLSSKKVNKSYIRRGNMDERTAKPARFEGPCAELKSHYSWQGDEANLLKCCEDKSADLEKGHFSKSRRRLFQDSTFDQLQENTNKFLRKGSKRGQCISSTYFKCRHQDQEYRSNNSRTSKLRVPTSSELRRSTTKPTSWEKKEFSCCSNCSNCNETIKLLNPKNSDKFNSPNTDQNNQLTQKGDNYGFGEAVNISSSDSLIIDDIDSCDEVNNNLSNVRRVLCLDELSEHVTKALNEMFMKLCPVDIACFNSYCTNETCEAAENDKKEYDEKKSTSVVVKENEKDNFSNRDNNSIAEVTNGKENRQTEDSSEDKINSADDDNFNQFGTEVARVLKQTNREKALRLKAAIKQTLESAKEEG